MTEATAATAPGTSEESVAKQREEFFERLEKTLSALEAPVTLHRIVEGDHSFAVPKRLGHDPASVRAEIADVVERWLAGLDQA